MEIIRIFISGIIATSAMTAFSYILSNIRDRQFREPELLNIVISRSYLSKESVAGWILHYIIGWIFVVVFELIWNLELFTSTILSGAILGFAAGIIGVIGWKVIFSLSKNPPEVKRDIEYYLQLIIAHIIFGVTAALIYNFW